MATVSALSYQKRNKLTYGSKPKRSAWNSTNVDEFFEEDDPIISEPVARRRRDIKSTYGVRKPDADAPASKPVKTRAKPKDTFDLPSSDEDDGTLHRAVSPPRLMKSKRTLVDDRGSNSSQLASWEKTLDEAGGGKQRSRKIGGGPEASRSQELGSAMRPVGAERNRGTVKGKIATRGSSNSMVEPVAAGTPELGSQSAAARLAARRRLAQGSSRSADESSVARTSIPKRAAPNVEGVESTVRKRARTASIPPEQNEDIVMADMGPATEQTISEAAKPSSPDTSIYDFPDSSADDLAEQRKAAVLPIIKLNSRRGKHMAVYTRRSPPKGSSAPARLAEMVPSDTDTPNSPSTSTSRRSSPQQVSTPSSHARQSPAAPHSRVSGTMTPKQAQLWSRLLPSDNVPSPSALKMKDLTISGNRRTAHGFASLNRKLTKSQSDVPRRRPRLVDRLKASAPASSEDEGSEDEDNSPDQNDDEIDQTAGDSKLPEKIDEVVHSQPQHSQSQGQTTPTAGGGPKITYSRVRSHLADDSLEDALMIDLAGDSAQPPDVILRPGHTAELNSQKSVFDIENSEDDGGPKTKTIHELRASGRNTRGIADIEYLMEEVKNHDRSHRNARRTALIQLATKLADKAFMRRFIAQSFESQLVDEFAASGDDIATFTLAAAIVLIIAAEPPVHTIQVLEDRGVLAWLINALGMDMSIDRMAKDRRNNLSKALQTDLLQFTKLLLAHSSLWDDQVPAALTPRLIALKGLDLMISRRRRMGDKSNLLDDEQLKAVSIAMNVPSSPHYTINFAQGISLLQSLSTLSSSLAWPGEVLRPIQALSLLLNEESESTAHTLFLGLRLCANLTNNNEKHCQEIGTQSFVQALLTSIGRGFIRLSADADVEKRKVHLDLLLLSLGVMSNLAEHSIVAGGFLVSDPALLTALLEIFKQGPIKMLGRESIGGSDENAAFGYVAFGYLAVMLANMCQNQDTKMLVAEKLPGKNLGMLITAVEEFVLYHQEVDRVADRTSFEGDEGKEVWGAFTEKLKAVLARLMGAG